MKLHLAQKTLRKYSSAQRAAATMRFFKTERGAYGHGDLFIGVTVPNSRKVAKQFRGMELTEVSGMLRSPIHEDRLLALLILVDGYQKPQNEQSRSEIADFYMQNRAAINNWDLVDLSAYKILGQHCLDNGETKTLRSLAKSSHHWDRRMAMVATFAFIRDEKTKIVYELAKQFLADEQDLMHKATGWMLREAGKRNSAELREFIRKFGAKMPRTMLRYAIEKFGQAERRKILDSTRIVR